MYTTNKNKRKPINYNLQIKNIENQDQYVIHIGQKLNLISRMINQNYILQKARVVDHRARYQLVKSNQLINKRKLKSDLLILISMIQSKRNVEFILKMIRIGMKILRSFNCSNNKGLRINFNIMIIKLIRRRSMNMIT